MDPYYNSWPKPSPFPICSFVLLIANVLMYYGLYSAQIPFYWMSPMFAINIFFFWAERNIYLRDKRNFEGWKKEVEEMTRPSVRHLWNERLRAVQRRKR